VAGGGKGTVRRTTEATGTEEGDAGTGGVDGLPSMVGRRATLSTSWVPSQKPLRRERRVPPGVMRSCTYVWVDPGIVAVTPRMGSVSSCSGDGNVSGAMLTREPAQRMVAAEAWASKL
jgi:hypothetical protein